jgi:lysophospholipase L1-like esterase
MSDLGAFMIRRRLGLVAGLAAIVAASTLYQSAQHHSVLGHYSPVFAAWLVLIVVLLVVAVVWSVVAPRPIDSSQALASLVESAWACLGAAYLASALNDRRYAARALDVNLFGSPFASSALLEYAALCCLLAAGILFAMRHARGYGQNILLVVGSLCVLTLLGEGVARLMGFIGAQTHGIPSYSGEVFTQRYVRLNREGFRDTEHALAPRPGTRRLLLVGDSYAFGAGLREPADRFGEQVQAKLTGMSGQPWEVINHSLGDRNTIDELVFLQQGLVYHPDVVILLYVFNDADYLADGGRGAAVDSGPPRARSGTQRSSIFEQPQSVLGRFEPARVCYWNSFLFQELYARWRVLRYQFAHQAPGAVTDVYRTPLLLQRHLADLAHFVRIADSANAVVAIVPIDPGVTSEASLRDRYVTFTDAAVRAGLPVWSIIHAYDGVHLDEITVNSLDRHLNALGYRLAVEAVAPEILAAMEKRLPGH